MCEGGAGYIQSDTSTRHTPIEVEVGVEVEVEGLRLRLPELEVEASWGVDVDVVMAPPAYMYCHSDPRQPTQATWYLVSVLGTTFFLDYHLARWPGARLGVPV